MFLNNLSVHNRYVPKYFLTLTNNMTKASFQSKIVT